MASLIPNPTKQFILQGGANLGTADLRVQFVDTANAADAVTATDAFLDAITPSALVGTPVALTGRATTDGTLSAFTTTFPAASGATSEAVVIYLEPAATPSAATRRIIAYLDGLSVVFNGGDISVRWGGTSTASVAGPIFTL